MARLPSERIRGRRAVELRRRRLEAEPLCRDCAARGRVTAATVPDHIVPLDKGGIEDGLVRSPNIQNLCQSCHDKKTRRDFGWRPSRPKISLDGWPIED